MRRHVPEHVAELAWRVGVRLSREASLRQAEAGELEQRVVAGDTLLEQGVDRPQARSAFAGQPTAAQLLLLR